MDTVTFSCEVFTPMFLNGADGQTPEFRVPSIKGAMRFWWRSLNAHLDLKALKKRETEIFGGSGERIQRSNIIIQVFSKEEHKTSSHELVPHKPFMKSNAFNLGTKFDVKLTLFKNIEDDKGNIHFNIDHLKSLFIITCYLGGLGKRVRRGMGSIDIREMDGIQGVIPEQVNLKFIRDQIEKFSPFYQLSGEKIVFAYNGRSPQYGYITDIQLGKPYAQQSEVLHKISAATHQTKQKHGFAYDPSMGHAHKGRYASPVYVSVVRGSVRPIITTLNLAPDKNANQASLLIQQDFKKQIL
jgi:CRISPR-associated protein Cmr1